MFVLILAITSAVSVSFGSQSLVLDSRQSDVALGIAQGLIEKAQADARKDFNLVNAYEADAAGGLYHENVAVEIRWMPIPEIPIISQRK